MDVKRKLITFMCFNYFSFVVLIYFSPTALSHKENLFQYPVLKEDRRTNILNDGSIIPHFPGCSHLVSLWLLSLFMKFLILRLKLGSLC